MACWQFSTCSFFLICRLCDKYMDLMTKNVLDYIVDTVYLKETEMTCFSGLI